MRNLFLILVLSLTVFAATRAVGMGLDHPGGAMSGAMAQMQDHDCPSCPDLPAGESTSHAACSDCATCNAVGREVLAPATHPIALRFSRVLSPCGACLAAGRSETFDPPPPRA